MLSGSGAVVIVTAIAVIMSVLVHFEVAIRVSRKLEQ